MRCEGADDPPCKRCRNNGMEWVPRVRVVYITADLSPSCLFEKPVRDTTNSEQGLELVLIFYIQIIFFFD